MGTETYIKLLSTMLPLRKVELYIPDWYAQETEELKADAILDQLREATYNATTDVVIQLSLNRCSYMLPDLKTLRSTTLVVCGKLILVNSSLICKSHEAQVRQIS